MARTKAKRGMEVGETEETGKASSRLSSRLPAWLVLALMVLSLGVSLGVASHRADECYPASGFDQGYVIQHRCYSDIPYIYMFRGLQANLYPYDNGGALRGDFPVGGKNDGAMEYPPIISYFAYGVARLSNGSHIPSVATYGDHPKGSQAGLYRFFQSPQVRSNVRNYYLLTTLFLALCGSLIVLFLTKLAPSPKSVLWLTASPLLGATAFINWDLLAVLLATASFLTWRRGSIVLTGILLGLGGATKLYPLLLAAALLYLLLSRKEWRSSLRLSAAVAGSFIVANLPALLTGFPEWKYFWSFNAARPADFGSVWLALELVSHKSLTLSTGAINLISYAILIGAYLALVLLLRRARQNPTYAELAVLVLLPFLLTQKVYSPQYALWLLPLVILAELPWWSKLLWQLAEGAYFWVVWEYIYQKKGSTPYSEALSGPYAGVIFLRIAGEVLLGVVILGKILRASDGTKEQDSSPVLPANEAMEEIA